MLNFIAISFIATSLLVSGLFSPNSVATNNGDQVIVKDGHRAVVVEYADPETTGDGNTKVLIYPPHHTKVSGSDDGELARASAAVAGVAEDVTGKAKEAVHGGPRDLICDAYGKCKHKVGDVLSRAKGMAAEAEEAVGEKVGNVKKKTEDTVESVKGFASRASDKVGEKMEKAKEKGEETGEWVKEGKEKGKKEMREIVKRGKEVARDVIEAGRVGRVMNLMGLAMGYGIGAWVTFVSSYVLAGVLPKQQFGVVQSKLYPVYFKGMAGSIGLCLIGHLIGHSGVVFRSWPHFLQAFNLLTCLLMCFPNLFFFEPRATEVMFQRMKLEKEEGRGVTVIDAVVTHSTGPTPRTTTAARTDVDVVKSKLGKLDDRLKRLNSQSSLLNVMTLMGLTWHLVYLSQSLGVTN